MNASNNKTMNRGFKRLIKGVVGADFGSKGRGFNKQALHTPNNNTPHLTTSESSKKGNAPTSNNEPATFQISLHCFELFVCLSASLLSEAASVCHKSLHSF